MKVGLPWMKNYNNVIGQECVDTIKINNNTIKSQCRNSKKILGSGRKTLIISIEQMRDIMEIANSLNKRPGLVC